ncbi:MAG: hypothetical protein R3E13_10310 [Alphaproteobacteria bacterium]
MNKATKATLTAMWTAGFITLAGCAGPGAKSGGNFTGSLNFGGGECTTGMVNNVGYKAPDRELAQQVAGQLYTGQTANLNLSEYEESAIATKTGPVITALSDLIENQGRQDFVNGYNAITQAHNLNSLKSGLESVAMPELRTAITENFSSLKSGPGSVDRDAYAKLMSHATDDMRTRAAQIIHKGLVAIKTAERDPCESNETFLYGVNGPAGGL